MLTKIRQALLISTAARNLAVDLVKQHGACALDIVDRAINIVDQEKKDVGNIASENHRILIASRNHITSLVGLLPDKPDQAVVASEAEEPATRLSNRSR
jgi:hypothetical protein